MISSRTVWLRLAVACLMMLTIGIASAETPIRKIELRITDHKPGIADFRELLVSLASVSIHAAESPRQEGWVPLIRETEFVDIVPLKDGVYTHLRTVHVPAGKYDAVRIRFGNLDSQLLDGSKPRLTVRDTTVGAVIDLVSQRRQIVLVDLMAENQTDHEPPGYVVKVREVRVSP